MAATEVETTRHAQDWAYGLEPMDSQSWSPLDLVRVMTAVVLGVSLGLGAWMLLNRNDGDPDVISADGGALSARQEQMVETVEDYVADLQATDGDGMAEHMTASGFVEYLGRDWTFSVTDGSLQEWFSNDRYGSLRLVGPMVVYEERVVLFGVVDDVGYSWASIISFTSTGDVRIVSERIDYW